MSEEMRDYVAWHATYDDPDSGLSWRLGVVRRYLREALDRQSGEVRVLSLCSGDGRDILGVLAERPDAERVTVTLVELDPRLAVMARDLAASVGRSEVTVLVEDAGHSDTWRTAGPADLVLLVGVFGNISDADLERTIAASPQLCRPGATLVWSRGRDRDDRNDLVRVSFGQAGFVELAYDERDAGSRPALGCVRYDGPPVAVVPGRRQFTFWR